MNLIDLVKIQPVLDSLNSATVLDSLIDLMNIQLVLDSHIDLVKIQPLCWTVSLI